MKKYLPSSRSVSHWLFIFSAQIIALIAVISLLASFVFIFGGHISAWIGWVAVVLTIVLTGLTSHFYFPEHGYLIALSILTSGAVVIVGAGIISGQFYDISYDGQAYQQEGIIALSEGWNPIHNWTVDKPEIGALERWVNHYPKGPWIPATTIYKMTGDIEQGKAFAIIFIFAAFAMVLSLLLRLPNLRWYWAVLVSFLVAVNPVSLYQSLSYYIDGQLFSLLVMLAALLVRMWFDQTRPTLVVLSMTVMVLVNMKFTAVAYVLVFLTAAFFIALFREKIKICTNLVIFSGAGLVLCLFLTGFNPYITNTITKKHPFYPLAGSKAINLKPYNTPQNFVHKPGPVILFLSVFSRSDNLRGEGSRAIYKWPFSFTKKELSPFTQTNAKEGGFGPFYSGGFLLSLVVFVSVLFLSKRQFFSGKEKDLFFLIGVVAAVVAVSSSINPISSLARYVPQFWLVAVLGVLVALLARVRWLLGIGLVLAAILLLNNILVFKTYLKYNLQTTRSLDNRLVELSKTNTVPLRLDFGEFFSTRIKLDAHHIAYVEEKGLPNCKAPKRLLLENVTQYCADK